MGSVRRRYSDALLWITAQPIGCEADTGTSAGGEHPHNSTDQQRQISIAATTDWQKIDAVALSIVAPPGWEFHQLQGVDSYVGEFAGDGFVLKFDFGEYSNPLKEEKKPAYVIVHKSIAGLPSKVVSPKALGHGITGIYFPRTFGGNKLSLLGQDLSSTQEELGAEDIRDDPIRTGCSASYSRTAASLEERRVKKRSRPSRSSGW